ncbi:MAG: tetratricopeptide repeat protein [bacterium]|nr:tetratricopeptide repeat protein [bacterium]
MTHFRRKSKIAALSLALVLGGAAFFLYQYYNPRPSKTEPVSPRGDTFQRYIQKKGEVEMTKRTALTLAVVYEKMLAQYPDNLELKKKLAKAYQDAGQDNKARPLLDEINRLESK